MPSRLTNPFAPVPVTRSSKPMTVRRDRRAVDVGEHLTPGSTTSRIGERQIRTRSIGITMVCLFSLLVARIGYLQVIRGSQYRGASERNRIRLETIRAPRGVIFDRNQDRLLMNVPNFTIFATPADLPMGTDERASIADRLANTTSAFNREKIRELIVHATYGSLQPVILAQHVSYPDAIRLSTVIARLPGVTLEPVSTRSYLDGLSTAHLIGYLGKPTESELSSNANLSPLTEVGRMGIEEQYDLLLRGTDGVREVERDHLNKELSVIANRDPLPGDNIVLNIEKGLQDVLYTSLHDTITKLRVPGAAAVALDPRNGEVLALVSVPSFDPNLFTQKGSDDDFARLFQDPNHPMLDRAISGVFPSGSTIKPVIASAALADGIINEHTTVNSTGGIRIGSSFFPDWKEGGHGVTDVRKALADSVNTFFYMVGGGYQDFKGLGLDRILHYLSLFGLGRKLGIDIPSEATGFIPTQEWLSQPSLHWYLGDTYHLAIGQGYIDVTPLQVATYTASIANGGTLYEPHIARKAVASDGTTVQVFGPKVVNTTVSNSVLSVVRSGMRQAVTSGSARALANEPFTVAGKTGTAQLGNGNLTHAWFTSFAPYDDPEIVVTVMVEEGGEGHAEALPIAQKALEWYFQHRKGRSP